MTTTEKRTLMEHIDITSGTGQAHLFQEQQIRQVKAVMNQKCEQCGDTHWIPYEVKNKREPRPLHSIVLKCGHCGNAIVIPTIAFLFESLQDRNWNN